MAAKFIVIFGPTSSGKSALALWLAQKINAVIVNSDSQQVYKELQVLSARPSVAEEQLAEHYLYGNLSGAEVCSVGKWLEMAEEVIKSVGGKKPIIFCGGTGLYLHALWNGLAKVPPIPDDIKAKVRAMNAAEVAAVLGGAVSDNNLSDNHRRNVRAAEVFLATGKHLHDWQAAQGASAYNPKDFLILVMNVSRETLYENINNRFAKMLDCGAIQEVADLLKMNLSGDAPIMRAVGVPELAAYLCGEMTIEEAANLAMQKTRNYAKRQLTWLRNQMPPSKIEVQNMSYENILKLVEESLL